MIDTVKQMAQSAQDRGWRLLIVGGYARDRVLGRESKDTDCEIYGPGSVDALIHWLNQFGDVNAVGKSFGVLKIGTDIDVSLPRRENKNGRGHKGFITEPDATLTPREAASRRDFTWNALAFDPLTNEMLDFFGGREDLLNGKLRHTSDAFSEDPLRVLRGFQFCGRFDLTATQETLDLCQELKNEFHTLPIERIWIEWEKWATKSVKPSQGLRFLRNCGWLEFWPELNDLVGCKQEPDHHPEGDAFDHALATVDAMAEIANRENRLVLMLAALTHDFGKPATTEIKDGRIISHGHDTAGVEPARNFLQSIGAPEKVIERVISLVVTHMRHVGFHTGGRPCARHARRLARDLAPATIQEWACVVEADHSGRPPLPGGLPKPACQLLEIAQELECQDSAPKCPLMGRHLIEMGMTPGPEFGQILKAAAEAFIEGEFSTVDEGKQWLAAHER